MHQTGVVAALGEDGLDPVFLAECLVMPDKLDLYPSLGRDLFGVDSQFLTQGCGPQRIVEQPDVVSAKEASHGLGVTDVRQGAGNDDPIEAGQLKWTPKTGQ